MSRWCRAFISTFLITLNLAFQASAAEPLPAKDDLFQKGLAAYQNKNYEQARESFQKLADEGILSARLLHNLALTHFQMNQRPRALALWRKALAIDPGFQPARAGRDMMEIRMNMRPFERDSFQLWMRRTLEHVSLFEMLWGIALLLAIVGGLWIRYFGERIQAVDLEQPMPPLPWAASAISFFFALLVGLALLKYSYFYNPRATIVAEKASARSLPADDGVVLFEIGGGTEVLIRREQSGWTQVQNSDGSTGWVKQSDILLSSEG